MNDEPESELDDSVKDNKTSSETLEEEEPEQEGTTEVSLKRTCFVSTIPDSWGTRDDVYTSTI